MRRVDGESKYKYQTERLQECDMPHSQSVRSCLLDSEFSMSAKAFGKKVKVEVYQIKKLTCRYCARCHTHLNSDCSLTFCIRYCILCPVLTFT